MDLWKDAKYGIRRLVETKWFTLAAVVALGLGIGANTTVFTLVNAVLLRGLPFDDAEQIVAFWTENQEGQRLGLSYQDYLDYREESRSFEELAAVLNSTVNLADEDETPQRAQGAYVTGTLFRVLGVSPVVGRDFRDDDDLPGSEPVVMLGYDLWQNRYQGDPDVIGRVVRVNSLPATVVGVMPEGMEFPFNNELWIPQTNLPSESNTADRGTRNMGGIGRLADGVSMDQARGELTLIAQNLEEAYPDTNEGIRPNLMTFQEDANGTEIVIMFTALMGAVIFVLLIACANVASILLAQALERSKEIAVRVSLGATRFRIIRQLLVESLLLAVVAGAFGFGLSVLGIRWFDSVTQDVGKPYWMEFTLDPVVFGFMALVCLGTALLFGLMPALQVSKTDVNEVLKEGARGGSGGKRATRLTGTLVVGQLVLTVVLLSGAGFMMRSFMNIYAEDVGVETEGLLVHQLYLPLTQYPELEPRVRVYQDFLDRMATVPAVEGTAIATGLPLGGAAGSGVEVDNVETEPDVDRPITGVLNISDEYFEVTGTELIRGRTFNRDDGLPGSRTAIVNQRFVEMFLQGGDALGRQVRVSQEGTPVGEAEWLTVVGVAPNVRHRNIEDAEFDPIVYQPLRSNPSRGSWVLVRARGDMAPVTRAVRETLGLVDPDLPLFNVMTMDEFLIQVRWPFWVFGMMFTTFAAIALILAGVGLYAVTANSVLQRVREFGIRVSLGAEPKQVSWLALRRVLIHLAVGLPIGMAGAVGVGFLLQAFMVRTTPGDPLTLGGIIVVMAAIVILASLWPARKAARLDPVQALRVE